MTLSNRERPLNLLDATTGVTEANWDQCDQSQPFGSSKRGGRVSIGVTTIGDTRTLRRIDRASAAP